MNEFGIIVGFASCLSLLIIGITTRSVFAHILSFMSGMFVMTETAAEGMPVLIVWAILCLAMYPCIQMVVLKKQANDDKEKK